MSALTDPAPGRWPVEASQVQYQNWLITVRTDKVRIPDGQQVERTVVNHLGAVAVLALDDACRVLMIRQYRHPVGRELWEIPAGLRDAEGESLLATAERELAEESGWRARRWHVLADTFTSPGFSTERIRIFLARDLEEVSDSGYEREHEEKFLVTEWVPLAEAVRAVFAGKLHNAQAVTGVLAASAAWPDGFAGLRPADAPEA